MYSNCTGKIESDHATTSPDPNHPEPSLPCYVHVKAAATCGLLLHCLSALLFAKDKGRRSQGGEGLSIVMLLPCFCLTFWVSYMHPGIRGLLERDDMASKESRGPR